MKKLKKVSLVIIAVSLLLIVFSAVVGNKSRPQVFKDYGVSDPETVINDKTGKWRYCTTNTTTPSSEYAAQLYKACMPSDGESDNILIIMNFTLNTTTIVRQITSGAVEVETHDRVEHEELDASTMGSGTVLTDEIYDLDTGKKLEY